MGAKIRKKRGKYVSLRLNYKKKNQIEVMLEHIAEFTAWPILTGIFIGYIANRIMSGEGKGYSALLVPLHFCGFGRNCLIEYEADCIIR